jgi:hypothetical protein
MFYNDVLYNFVISAAYMIDLVAIVVIFLPLKAPIDLLSVFLKLSGNFLKGYVVLA